MRIALYGQQRIAAEQHGQCQHVAECESYGVGHSAVGKELRAEHHDVGHSEQQYRHGRREDVDHRQPPRRAVALEAVAVARYGEGAPAQHRRYEECRYGRCDESAAYQRGYRLPQQLSHDEAQQRGHQRHHGYDLYADVLAHGHDDDHCYGQHRERHVVVIIDHAAYQRDGGMQQCEDENYRPRSGRYATAFAMQRLNHTQIYTQFL